MVFAKVSQKAVVSLLCLSGALACSPKTQSTPENNRKNFTKTASQAANSQTLPLPYANNSDGFYLAPSQARATLEQTVTLSQTPLFPTLKAPKLEFTFQKSDFVQVLRCAASYRLQTLAGEDLRQVLGRGNANSEFEWAWAQAIEDERKCKVVGNHISSPAFWDYTAPKGEYYYVINPCVSQEHVAVGEQACSYALTLSYPVTVTDAFRQEVQDKTIALAQAENSLTANMENAVQLARKISIHLRACEDMVAQDQQVMDFQKGLIQIGMLGVGGALGYVLGGFNPNMAVMGGTMVMMMGSQLLYSKALKWPAVIANECIDPTVVATSAAQRQKAAKNDPSHMAKYQGKYEAEFQVQTLIKRLASLLDPEKGPIALDTAKVQKLLEELYTYDIAMVTLDATYAKAATLGVDMSDPKTFKNILQDQQNPLNQQGSP